MWDVVFGGEKFGGEEEDFFYWVVEMSGGGRWRKLEGV